MNPDQLFDQKKKGNSAKKKYNNIMTEKDFILYTEVVTRTSTSEFT